MASHRVLMVIALLLLASLLAHVHGDAAQHNKDQKTSADAKQARPESHSGGWSGGGWGGGGWGGGGRGGGGGWGGGGHGGGWGGGGWGCRYRCGYRCCSPQEIAKIEQIEAMNTERMTAEDASAGKEGWGGGGHGGGGGWGGGGGHGGGGGCRYWCGRKCCGSPEEMAKFKRDVEMTLTETQESSEVKPERWGGGGCHYWCGRRCCTPAEMATQNKEAAVDPKTVSVKQGEVKN